MFRTFVQRALQACVSSAAVVLAESVFLTGALLLTGFAAQAAPPAVLQRGYTPGVINANTAETILTTSNVSPTTFGRVFSLPVDGGLYAQPLYVPGVAIPNQGTHNVLYVATMSDSIFAFDADVPGAPLWAVNYATLLGATPVPITTFVGTNSLNVAGTVGIESTPVIDASTQTLYFVTNTLENGTVVFRLHAVDITTGAEKFGGSVVITGTYTAGGKTLTFTPSLQNQRVSLTIAKNQVVVAFGSHEDDYKYYGWMMAYNKTSLAQTGVFNPVPTADHGGGIWQSGLPPAVDSSGYVYAFSGNSWAASGATSAYDGVNNFTETALKLDPGNSLHLVDYFTPANYQSLDNADNDLSAGGPLLIPNTTTLLAGGKDGVIYLSNTQNMGKMQSGNTGALQAFQATSGNIRGGVAYWPRSTAAGGPVAFVWGSSDALRAYPFNGSTLATTPSAQYTPPVNLYPGGELALSSNGDTQGIVWALMNAQGGADHRVPPGSLQAVNAATLSPLWNSTTNAPRDDFGLLAKWVPPMIVNGKVYVATASNQIAVYGLLPASGSTVTAWPMTQAALGGSAAFVVSALSAAGTPQTATWSVSGLPTGASGSFVTDAQGQTVLQITAGSATPPGNAIVQATANVNGTQTSQPVLVKFSQGSVAAATTATADGYYPNNPPSYAIDGNPGTFWETPYGTTTPNYPHELTIDLGSVKSIYGISYLPRQDGCSNGTILQYTVSVSADDQNYPEVAGGSFDYGPQWHSYNCAGNAFFLPKRLTVTFPATPGRYVELTGLGSVTNVDPWATAAEVQVFTTAPTATPIVPYLYANGVWTQTNTATVVAGTAVDIGPQPLTGGSWSWTGPNGFTATSREIDNIPLGTGANVYVATYTNAEGVASTANFTITVAKPAQQTQTITFGAIAAQKTGTTLALGATASSGLAVTYTSSTTNLCTVSGSTASFIAAGTCTITASQPGNATYAAATPVTQSIAVTAAGAATAIVPYVYANGAWAQTAAATVAAGTVVNLGPQPVSGGSWSWTGPNGFTSTSRELDYLPLRTGSNVYVATYTNAAGVSSTASFTITVTGTATATAIVPYVAVSGAWTQTASASVTAGTVVNLGPQPVSGGSWSWTGPNGFKSAARELDGIPLATGSNVYVATYQNSYGVQSTASFTITVH